MELDESWTRMVYELSPFRKNLIKYLLRVKHPFARHFFPLLQAPNVSNAIPFSQLLLRRILQPSHATASSAAGSFTSPAVEAVSSSMLDAERPTHWRPCGGGTVKSMSLTRSNKRRRKKTYPLLVA